MLFRLAFSPQLLLNAIIKSYLPVIKKIPSEAFASHKNQCFFVASATFLSAPFFAFLFSLLPFHSLTSTQAFLLIFAEKSIVEGGRCRRYCEILRTIDIWEIPGSARRGTICAKRSSLPFEIVFSVMFLY